MADKTTKKYRMEQKVSDDERVILHPETEASVVLAEVDGIDSSNVEDILGELAQRVTLAESSGVTGIKGSEEEEYRTGAIEITAENIGLGNVDNTADADKPISNATQTALDKLQESIDALGDSLYVFDGTDDGNVPVGAVVFVEI
ncbi:MAG: hypothetical protein LUE27_05440 [Clostridia bacterium]|nr:hypothetical protein [Clostridia bacterium]